MSSIGETRASHQDQTRRETPPPIRHLEIGILERRERVFKKLKVKMVFPLAEGDES
jgi:hypothetical protein